MPHMSKETITVAWCDNGMVDGKFAEGLVYTVLTAAFNGIPVVNAMRVQGNQIGRQRQVLFDMWYDQGKTDWLMWVDSDIVLTTDVFKLIWNTADKHSRPVVTGTYFISKQTESSLMQPMPALFNETGKEFEIQYIHPLPEPSVIKVDCAGMGLALMHRSIVPILREKFPNQSMFAEQEGLGEQYVGEDIVFFRKLKAAGIPVHAHTGATVKHMKRFAYDENYYRLYWHAAKAAEAQSGDTTSEQ